MNPPSFKSLGTATDSSTPLNISTAPLDSAALPSEIDSDQLKLKQRSAINPKLVEGGRTKAPIVSGSLNGETVSTMHPIILTAACINYVKSGETLYTSPRVASTDHLKMITLMNDKLIATDADKLVALHMVASAQLKLGLNKTYALGMYRSLMREPETQYLKKRQPYDKNLKDVITGKKFFDSAPEFYEQVTGDKGGVRIEALFVACFNQTNDNSYMFTVNVLNDQYQSNLLDFKNKYENFLNACAAGDLAYRVNVLGDPFPSNHARFADGRNRRSDYTRAMKIVQEVHESNKAAVRGRAFMGSFQ